MGRRRSRLVAGVGVVQLPAAGALADLRALVLGDQCVRFGERVVDDLVGLGPRRFLIPRVFAGELRLEVGEQISRSAARWLAMLFATLARCLHSESKSLRSRAVILLIAPALSR